MQKKLPYYMVYPMPFVYDDGRREERDIEYMKSLYPDMAKRLLPYVEEECDRMEYQNSMMYDEYPDKLQLRMMCRRVHDLSLIHIYCRIFPRHGIFSGIDGRLHITLGRGTSRDVRTSGRNAG